MNEIPDPAVERCGIFLILAGCIIVIVLKIAEPLLIQWITGW